MVFSIDTVLEAVPQSTAAIAGALLFTFFLAVLGRPAKRESTQMAAKGLGEPKRRTKAPAMPEGEYEVIIVGAGCAGASLAASLGRQKKRVLVVERDLSEQDRIVGELLQPGGYKRLKDLQLDKCVEGIDAPSVYGYVLFNDKDECEIEYPPDEDGSKLAGRSFHNGRFIQNLRKEVRQHESVDLVEGTVLRLVDDGSPEQRVVGVEYRLADGSTKTAKAHLTIACDGIFSKFRRTLSTPDVKVTSYFVGIVLRDCDLPCPNRGHVILARPSPVLFYPISSTEVRALVSCPGKLPSSTDGSLNKYLLDDICPQLPEKLRKSFRDAIANGDVKSMPSQKLNPQPLVRPGALLLGDAFNMRHPLTGGGMTVALSDVVVMRDLFELVDDLSDKDTVQLLIQNFYTLRGPAAATINILADALFGVFSKDGGEEMREACFEYLKKGGVFAAGPIGFLSGISPKPYFLIFHFFSVAVFGVLRILLPFPTPGRIRKALNLFLAAVHIIRPLLYAERESSILVRALSFVLGRP